MGRAETLDDTLATTLSETEVETIANTLRNVKSAEVLHTLISNLKRQKLGNQ